jgi:hypothetical protein
MKQKIFTTLVLFMMLIPTTASAIEVSDGGKHNGAFLSVTKTEVAGKGVRIEANLECRKNHGGRSFGVADVVVEDWKDEDKIKSVQLKCNVAGDALTSEIKKRSDHKVLLIPNVTNTNFNDRYEVYVRVKHTSNDFWKEFVEDSKSTLLDATTPEQILQAGYTLIGL